MAENTTTAKYQVRTNGGTVFGQYADIDDAEMIADNYRHYGWRTYVVFVELIDGAWVATED